MSQKLIPSAKRDKVETLHLMGHTYRKSRFFAAFLICVALLVAAFAVSGVWISRGGEGDAHDPSTGRPADQSPPAPKPSPEEPSLQIPVGAIPIRDADLSGRHLGAAYFHNETGYTPDIKALLQTDASSSHTKEPLVLILHTHTTESYLPSGTAYIEGEIGDRTYTSDPTQNMIAVGRALADTLNEKSITAIHCTVMHDAKDFSSAYANAEESIRFYLTHYPSIRYVIDLHRDSVVDTDGAYIRSSIGDGETRTAQVMAVVGSDAGGTEHSRWEGNLALALQLRECLDARTPGVSRPPSLRNETYNQEHASYSLLLEIGTGANSLEEALRSARLVGEALAELIIK